MKLVLENWRQYLNKDSQPIDIEVNGGSISGVIHNDIQRVLNWGEKERLDDEAMKIISSLSTPIAILKNMYVDEELRGQGLGSELIQRFLEEVYDIPAILISEEGETNTFDLANWYEGYGFEAIGSSGGAPVLLRLPQ
jgi:GNAT superfamily N-acetyltransferase